MTKDSLAKEQLDFEEIKHINEDGIEFWYARELMYILGYKDWRYFNNVIEKATISCANSNTSVQDHFVAYTKMIQLAKSAQREILDYKLTRYACYLIAQNSNPKLKSVALAQTYFAIQTRKQELSENEYKKLSEDEKRLYNRKIIADKNKYLFDTAKASGVKDYAKFNNAGYTGLYNGETAEDIKIRKGLSEKEHILDHMGSAELGANIFRITQTDEILKTNNIDSEIEACTTHNKVGKAVRKAIKELGGTMPEDLPTPPKSIKQIEKETKTLKKSSNKK